MNESLIMIVEILEQPLRERHIKLLNLFTPPPNDDNADESTVTGRMYNRLKPLINDREQKLGRFFERLSVNEKKRRIAILVAQMVKKPIGDYSISGITINNNDNR